ncbi:MAG: serpin family protein [candidate division WOR-3 bacterium]|nr:serpin family protein [candidate division WOR-3 bacterium]MCX7757709.1 serpin family protein [candidate division WOR-3 bacterium]MDW7988088.1 serpin family protein [candidate division WOR-3 bacterium]
MKNIILFIVLAVLFNFIEAHPNNLEKLTLSQNEFGFKIFAELTKTEKLKNIIISPTSIILALAMAYNGAQGETKEAIAKVLGISELEDKTFNETNLLLQNTLSTQNKKLILKIANSLWIDKSCKFKKPFIEINKKFYRAKLSSLNFASPNAIEMINRWVKDATNGKIEKIATEIPEDVWAILINALYFKGAWQEAFNKTQTKEMPFYRLDGTEKSHLFMYKKSKFLYFENDEIQTISIPYANGTYTMDIFLPKKEFPIEKLVYTLSYDRYLEWQRAMETRDGEVYLPRFKLDYETSLKEVLSNMDMKIAFEPGLADFTKMATTPIKGRMFIGDVKHKTYIEVSEEGTEAAAVTGVFMEIKSAPSKPFTMILDRPFLYIIRNSKTQTVVFIGILTEPK